MGVRGSGGEVPVTLGAKPPGVGCIEVKSSSFILHATPFPMRHSSGPRESVSICDFSHASFSSIQNTECAVTGGGSRGENSRRGSWRTAKDTDPGNHIATLSGSWTGSEEPPPTLCVSPPHIAARDAFPVCSRGQREGASERWLVSVCTEPARPREPRRSHRGPSSWRSPGESKGQERGVACGPVLCRLVSPRILPQEGTSVEQVCVHRKKPRKPQVTLWG